MEKSFQPSNADLLCAYFEDSKGRHPRFSEATIESNQWRYRLLHGLHTQQQLVSKFLLETLADVNVFIFMLDAAEMLSHKRPLTVGGHRELFRFTKHLEIQSDAQRDHNGLIYLVNTANVNGQGYFEAVEKRMHEGHGADPFEETSELLWSHKVDNTATAVYFVNVFDTVEVARVLRKGLSHVTVDSTGGGNLPPKKENGAETYKV